MNFVLCFLKVVLECFGNNIVIVGFGEFGIDIDQVIGVIIISDLYVNWS